MTGKTHSAGGAAAGAAAGHLIAPPFGGLVGMVLGSLAGLLPDVDHPGSTAGRKLGPLSVVISQISGGHRGLTHTIWFCILATLVSAPLSIWLGRYARPILHYWPSLILVTACVFVGGLSHLVLDSLTVSGIEPLAPLCHWHPRGPVRTGEMNTIEMALTVLLIVLAIKAGGLLSI